MGDLNNVRIDLAALRMEIAWLQQDGFSEIGLEDFLRFIAAYLHSEERLEFMMNEKQLLVPLVDPRRATAT